MLGWLADRPGRRLAIWLGRRCGSGDRRRCYLFATACFVRTAGAPISPKNWHLVTNVLADRTRSTTEYRSVTPWNEGILAGAAVSVEEWAGRWAEAAARCVAWQQTYSGGRLDWPEFQRARIVERRVQAGLLRCIFSNPFRPQPAIDREWLELSGQEAVGLARVIRDAGAFHRLPELADALEDAGFTDAHLIHHFREAEVHARGCRALEIVAGAGQAREIDRNEQLGVTTSRPLGRAR
jgi:hypothetical protein